MKKSFSLIELIFTIVIIAFIFTVIPKVMYSTNQTFSFTLKEGGIYNMMSKMMDVVNQEWDENNTDSQDPSTNILVTGNNNVLECQANADDSKSLRVGGFYSGDKYSRICPEKKTYVTIFGIKILTSETPITVSDIGPDANETSEADYDDVDDYNATEDNTTDNRYTLIIDVGYSDEWSKDDYNYDNQSLNFTFTNNLDANKSNIKLVKITLYDNKYDKNISDARYWGANIGLIPEIENRQW